MTPSPKKLVEEILGYVPFKDPKDFKKHLINTLPENTDPLLRLLKEAMQAIDETRDVDGILCGRFQDLWKKWVME